MVTKLYKTEGAMGLRLWSMSRAGLNFLSFTKVAQVYKREWAILVRISDPHRL